MAAAAAAFLAVAAAKCPPSAVSSTPLSAHTHVTLVSTLTPADDDDDCDAMTTTEEDTFTSVNWDTPADDDQQGRPSSGPHGSADTTQMPGTSLPRAPHRTATSTSIASSGGGGGHALAGVDPVSLAKHAGRASNADEDDSAKRTPRWEGFLMVQVTDPRKEQEGSKEMFVSYGIRAETNLMHFRRTRMTTRRRFQDFVFLREHLSKDFPACVVPPLPEKHRLEYFTGDRFSNEFLERRTQDLQLFLERVCRHPTLQRAQLLRSFLESTEWQVDMHSHTSQSSGLSPHGGLNEGQPGSGGILDSLSDTLLNAFSRVRKPDEKYEAMRERLERLEEGLGNTERVVQRTRSRHGAPLPSRSFPPSSTQSSAAASSVPRSPSSSRFSNFRAWTSTAPSITPDTTQTQTTIDADSVPNPASPSLTSPFHSPQLFAPSMGLESQDLATDYEDLAGSIEGLAFLESGITEPLNRFAATSMEWARLQRNNSSRATNDMLQHLHAILSYAGAHRNVLRLRDQKQVDFEALTDILSHEVTERDRLASLSSPYGAGHGHGGVRGTGIGGYLRDRVDSLRGVDEERTRVERMARLDSRIAQLQEEVTTSHDISVAFSNEVQKEHIIFNLAKDQEMKMLLGTYVDGQTEMYQRGLDLWDRLIPHLERIRVSD